MKCDIAFISTMDGCSWGGSETLWSQAALRLRGLGANVAVNIVRWRETPPEVSALDSAGCRIKRRATRSVSSRLVRATVGDQSFRWIDRVRPSFAVVAQGGNFDGVPWMLELLRRGIPYASIAQMANENYWPHDSLAAQAVTAYHGAERAFFVANANVRLTEQQLGARLPNAEVVRNPFNVDFDVNVAWPSDRETRLACVGRLCIDAKGQDLILKVLSLPRWRQRPIRLSLFGVGPNDGLLRRLARMYALGNVEFHGQCSDIRSIWADHHALVLPSRYEGMPLSLVEAMLCGRVCIVTDTAGNAELIQDGITGFLAAAPRATCLEQAMENAWERRLEWNQIGQRTAQAVRCAIPMDPVGAFTDRLRFIAGTYARRAWRLPIDAGGTAPKRVAVLEKTR